MSTPTPIIAPGSPTTSPPESASPVNTNLKATFHTLLEDIPSGDYLLILSGDRRELHYDALSWDAAQQFPLVTISGDENTRMGGEPFFDPTSWQILGPYHDDQIEEGLYIVNLTAQELLGFSYGCDDSRHVLLPGYMAMRCAEDDVTWHFISRQTWEVAFSRLYTETNQPKRTELEWNDETGLLVYVGDDAVGFDTICTIGSEFETTQTCQSTETFQSGRISPDGRWIEIQKQDDAGTHFGVLSSGCLQEDNIHGCEIQWIEDAPVDERGDLSRNAVWTPDSNKILYVISQCIGTKDFQKTTFWVYDLTTSSSKVLASFPRNCYGFHFTRDSLWSPDGSSVLIDLALEGFFLFNPETGELRRFMGNDPPLEIVGGFTIP